MFSTNVWILCERIGMSKKRLAEEAGVSYGTIRKIMLNQENVRVRTKEQIANALNTTVERLESVDLSLSVNILSNDCLRKNIRLLCGNRCITYKELSVAAGLHHDSVSCIVRGIHTPQKATVAKLAEVLGITIEELMSDDLGINEVREDIENIGRNIHKLCEIANVSQRRIAQYVGVTESTISKIVHFRHRPRNATLRKIAEYWNTTPQDLMIYPNEALYKREREKNHA